MCAGTVVLTMSSLTDPLIMTRMQGAIEIMELMSTSSIAETRLKVDFVESEAPRLHPAFSHRVKHDVRSNIFVPRGKIGRVVLVQFLGKSLNILNR